MKIAVVGCVHGELDVIYNDITSIEKNREIKIDLLIICGDFQAIRNEHDLQCMAVPHHHRRLGTFYKYYTGELQAPVLTLFIGGNHEASNYLQTLPYGGWVAPKIYYLGYSNVVQFGGLRIGGISGIHKRGHEHLGHFERLPYDEDTKRSAYHVRSLHVYQMLQLNKPDGIEKQQIIDIFITHDWPINIHTCGDVDLLLRKKKHFYNDIRNNSLGNPLYKPLVDHLKPRYWFAAHMHVKFNALINYCPEKEIMTRFLALDKINHRQEYLEIFEIEEKNSNLSLEYDPEWLAILCMTNELMSIERNPTHRVPSFWRFEHRPSQDVIDDVLKKLNSDFKVPENFKLCEPTLEENDLDPKRITNYRNPQTTEFCSKLNLIDPIQAIIDSMKVMPNPDQIDISDEEDNDDINENKEDKNEDKIDPNDTFFIDRKGDHNL